MMGTPTIPSSPISLVQTSRFLQVSYSSTVSIPYQVLRKHGSDLRYVALL